MGQIQIPIIYKYYHMMTHGMSVEEQLNFEGGKNHKELIML